MEAYNFGLLAGLSYSMVLMLAALIAAAIFLPRMALSGISDKADMEVERGKVKRTIDEAARWGYHAVEINESRKEGYVSVLMVKSANTNRRKWENPRQGGYSPV